MAGPGIVTGMVVTVDLNVTASSTCAQRCICVVMLHMRASTAWHVGCADGE
jgi:hypothetical protein